MILCSCLGWIWIRSICLLRNSLMLKLKVILVGANQENGFKQGKEDLKLGGLVIFPMRWDFFFFENHSRYSERADMWWGFEKLRRCCVWNIPRSMFGLWHFRRMISYCLNTFKLFLFSFFILIRNYVLFFLFFIVMLLYTYLLTQFTATTVTSGESRGSQYPINVIGKHIRGGVHVNICPTDSYNFS